MIVLNWVNINLIVALTLAVLFSVGDTSSECIKTRVSPIPQGKQINIAGSFLNFPRGKKIKKGQ